MRRLLPLFLLSLLTGCDDQNGPVNRIVIPQPIPFTSAPALDLTPFRSVYYDKENQVALFFLGDEHGMSVQFVNAEGLIDPGRLLSREDRARRGEDDEAGRQSDGANVVLARSGLPDRAFEVVPAQGGYLLQYRYGKLSYISYAAVAEAKLKLGAAADLDLLARLATSAGFADAFRALPTIGSPPGRLLLFTRAPAALGTTLVDNAAGLFHEVAQADKGWEALSVRRPTSLADTAGITAIQSAISAR